MVLGLSAPGEAVIMQTPGGKKRLTEVVKKRKKSKTKIFKKKIGEIGKGVLKKTLFKRDSGGGRNPFGRNLQPETFTKEQHMLRGMFGHGDRVMTNFDGRSLPVINNLLTSGGGILKSGDQGETRDLFKGGRSLPFFGGGRR